MQGTIARRTEQFIENRKRIERAFRLSTPQTHCLCALLLGLDDRDADLLTVRRGKKTLRRNTGLFSAFRGLGMAPAAIKLGEYENGEQRLNDAKDSQRKLKAAGFAPTDYLCPAAFLMAKQHDRAEIVAANAYAHYREMRHENRVLTGGEDVLFAVLFAMYDLKPETVTARMNTAMDLLSTRFHRSNAAQMASFAIAAASDEGDRLAGKTERLYDAVRDAGVKNRETLDVPLLAFLAALGADECETAQKIAEVNAQMKAQKGFSAARVGRSQRLFYATALVAIDTLFSTPMGSGERAKMRDLLQTLMLSGILLFIVVAMSAAKQ